MSMKNHGSSPSRIKYSPGFRCRSAAPRARRSSCNSGRHDIRGNCLSSSTWNKGPSISRCATHSAQVVGVFAGDGLLARLACNALRKGYAFCDGKVPRRNLRVVYGRGPKSPKIHVCLLLLPRRDAGKADSLATRRDTLRRSCRQTAARATSSYSSRGGRRRSWRCTASRRRRRRPGRWRRRCPGRDAALSAGWPQCVAGSTP